MSPAKVKSRPAYNFARDGVTQSMLGKWLECRTEAKFALRDRLEQLRTSSALTHGIVTHSALEVLHREQARFEGRVPTEERVVAVARAACRKWSDEHTRASDSEAEDFELISAQIEAVLPEYFKYWTKSPLAWVDVESKFDVPFEGTRLRGKFDGVFKRGTAWWLYDAKNKSRIEEEQLGEVLLRDFQVNFYLLALWMKTGKRPAGFLYTILRRPSLKLGRDESLPAHVKRIRAHIAEDPDHYFKRYEVALTLEDLEAFKAELVLMLRDFKVWAEGGMPGLLYGQPCVRKYGLCPMLQACFNQNTAPYRVRDAFFPELEE